MRAPALLPPALLTCCGWLLAPVSALGPAPSRPAAPTLPGGSAPGSRLDCASGSRAGLGRGAGIWAGPGARGSGLVPGLHPPSELAGRSRPAGDSGLTRRARRTEAPPRPGVRPGREGAFARSAPPSRVCWEQNPVPCSTSFLAEQARGRGAPSGVGDWAAVTCAGFSLQREIGVCLIKYFPFHLLVPVTFFVCFSVCQGDVMWLNKVSFWK